MQNRFSKFLNLGGDNISLNNRDIKASDIHEIMQCVIHHQIKSLDLGLNNIGDDGAITIAEALPFTNLQVLLLPSCEIKEKGLEALAKVFKSGTYIVSFDLSYNEMCEIQRDFLRCAVVENPNIIDAQFLCGNLLTIKERYFRFLLRDKLIYAWQQVDKRKDFTIHDVCFVQKHLPLMNYIDYGHYKHTETFKNALPTIDMDLKNLLVEKLCRWPNRIFSNLPNELSTKILYTVFLIAPEKLKCILLSPYQTLDNHKPKETDAMQRLREESMDSKMGYHYC